MKPGANNQLVISIAKKDSAVFWDGLQLGEASLKTGDSDSTAGNLASNDQLKWHTFKMTTLVPGNLPSDSKIKIYIWNADGRSETDVDEMEIIFTETPLTSFLPR